MEQATPLCDIPKEAQFCSVGGFDNPDLRPGMETMLRGDTDLSCRLANITVDIPKQCGFPAYKSHSHVLHGIQYIYIGNANGSIVTF
jgi:hypothetical protein